ncbi:hypothetical protein DPMN_156477 [Dreissena polymorpha]|uniref:Uncharacterized protein n=1 Tax=Dreissena polymorpha TaxID=45954 RepID=A0A9D4FPW1_DREPO|nr:hypothetical protein DPMN_156477 [Dreissena polymorpha]
MVYDQTSYARWGPVYLADIKALEYASPEVFKEFIEGHFVVSLKEKAFNGVPEECIKKMMQLFDSYAIFGVHEEENRLFSIASKDVATYDITDDLLT